MRRKYIIVFLLIGLNSCEQKPAKHKVDPSAIELNKKAMKLALFLSTPDSAKKAILFLDSATAIDSNYFLGYYNKLMFLYALKQYDKAILTIEKLIKLKPNAYDLYFTGGLFCVRKGDSTMAETYFQKSLSICNIVLDTMNSENKNYEMFSQGKAINLIMLGETEKANQLLKELSNKTTDTTLKSYYNSLLNKNKNDFFESLENDMPANQNN